MVGRLTATVSAPRLSKAFADGLEVSRVTPRTAQDFLMLESPRTALTTEPPWTPVAPKTTRIFLLAIAIGVGCYCEVAAAFRLGVSSQKNVKSIDPVGYLMYCGGIV